MLLLITKFQIIKKIVVDKQIQFVDHHIEFFDHIELTDDQDVIGDNKLNN